MAKMILDYVFKYANEIEEGKETAEMNLVYISKYAIAKKGQGQEMAKIIFPRIFIHYINVQFLLPEQSN
jgi:hypothetical protein